MRLGILGLGLIGGSLGYDLRARGHRVVGVTRQAASAEKAVALGAVDWGGTDLGLLAEAEVVFVCTPIGALAASLEALKAVLDPATIVTDVASVKGMVVPLAASLWPRFVGGHPMAGSAEQGIDAAHPGLFIGRPYVLTPTAATDPTALACVRSLVDDLQAQPIEMAPEVHDRAVARISHLPVLVSAALLLNLGDDPDGAALASSGFFDTTRVGGGNPELGAAMAEFNRQAVLAELASYQKALARLEHTVATADWPTLTALLATCRTLRARVFPPTP